MKLIDADALKAEINVKNVVGRFNTLLLIDNAPEVDISKIILIVAKRSGKREMMLDALRPKSEWIQREEIFDDEETSRLVWGCKDCGFSLKSIHDKRNYCPNCGAKMQESGAE